MLRSAETGVIIRYTFDGNTPSLENSLSFDNPLMINTTTVLRARALGDGHLPSRTSTHTYLFVGDVGLHGNTSPGYPTKWRADSGGTLLAVYEMDSEITEHLHYANIVNDAILAVTTISLVTDIEPFFLREKTCSPVPADGDHHFGVACFHRMALPRRSSG